VFEKSLALDLAGAREMAVAAGAGRILMVGQLLRYQPAFRRLEALTAAGALGAVRRIFATRMNLRAIRREEEAPW
jgi:predicted dehydrogenase